MSSHSRINEPDVNVGVSPFYRETFNYMRDKTWIMAQRSDEDATKKPRLDCGSNYVSKKFSGSIYKSKFQKSFF